MSERTDTVAPADGLVRRIGPAGAVAIAVTMVVGSGVFGLPGLALATTDPATALIGWAVVILAMAPMVLVFATLGADHPTAAGIARFAALGFGSRSLPGFTMIACGALAVGMPAFFLVGGAYLAELLGLRPSVWRGPCAIALAAAATALNLRGTETLGRVNTIAVGVVLALALGLAVFRLPPLAAESAMLADALARTVEGDGPPVAAVWLAASIVVWAFFGWENLSFGLEEFRDPARTIPAAFAASFVVVAGVYFLFAWVISAAALAGAEVGGLSGVAGLLGEGPVRVVLLAVLVFVLFTNANAWVFGASRAFYAAAGQGLLPRGLARTDSRGQPAAALIGAFAFYALVIAAMELARIPETYAFQLTTQGFVLLFGAAVVAYLRGRARRPAAWVVGAAALAGWAFLVSGFSWLLIYPAVLFAWGLVAGRRRALARADGAE